jgi:hypothetical protein
MWGLERHANSLGRPGQGLHRPRVFGLAAVDLGLALGLAAVASPLVPVQPPWGKFAVSVVCVCALGVAAHEVFGVRTALNNKIFGRR